LMECIAAGCTPIDLPCTYLAEDAIIADMALSTQLGFTSKCVVFSPHVRHVNDALTPSDAALRDAQHTVDAYARQSRGDTASGWIDAPERNNALRLIARHRAFTAAKTGNSSNSPS
jgi:citrate lyase subunit beta/citryl-CoA lyase